MDFYRLNEDAKRFEYDGWVWGMWKVGRNDELFGYNRWHEGRETVLSQIEPYLNRLESLVGKEVPSYEVLPNFSEDGPRRIPDTGYNLSLTELDEEGSTRYFRQEGLIVPTLDMPKGVRKAAFSINSSGGGISMVHHLAFVAGIAYEGRINS